MTTAEAKSLLAQLLAQRAKLARLHLDLPPDKRMLLLRLEYRLGYKTGANQMARAKKYANQRIVDAWWMDPRGELHELGDSPTHEEWLSKNKSHPLLAAEDVPNLRKVLLDHAFNKGWLRVMKFGGRLTVHSDERFPSSTQLRSIKDHAIIHKADDIRIVGPEDEERILRMSRIANQMARLPKRVLRYAKIPMVSKVSRAEGHAAPSVDFDAKDLQNTEDFLPEFPGAKVYHGFVPIDHLPSPRLAEEEETRPDDWDDESFGEWGQPGYDWDEFRHGATYPPPKLLWRNGKFEILDGNHRIHYWTNGRGGYTHIPAVVIVPRPEKKMSRLPRRVLRLAKAEKTRAPAHHLIAGFPLEHALRHLANDPANSDTLRQTAFVALTGRKGSQVSPEGHPEALWALHDLLQDGDHNASGKPHPLSKAYNWMSAADKIVLDGKTRQALVDASNDAKIGVPHEFHGRWAYTPEIMAVHALTGIQKKPAAPRDLVAMRRQFAKEIIAKVKGLSPHASDDEIKKSIRRHAYRARYVSRVEHGIPTDQDEIRALQHPSAGPRPDADLNESELATRYRRVPPPASNNSIKMRELPRRYALSDIPHLLHASRRVGIPAEAGAPTELTHETTTGKVLGDALDEEGLPHAPFFRRLVPSITQTGEDGMAEFHTPDGKWAVNYGYPASSIRASVVPTMHADPGTPEWAFRPVTDVNDPHRHAVLVHRRLTANGVDTHSAIMHGPDLKQWLAHPGIEHALERRIRNTYHDLRLLNGRDDVSKPPEQLSRKFARLRFGQSRPFTGPKGEAMTEHDYHDAASGQKLGVMRVLPRNDGQHLHIEWVGPTSARAGDPEAIGGAGADGIRSLKGELKRVYPQAQFVSGFRGGEQGGGFRSTPTRVVKPLARRRYALTKHQDANFYYWLHPNGTIHDTGGVLHGEWIRASHGIDQDNALDNGWSKVTALPADKEVHAYGHSALNGAQKSSMGEIAAKHGITDGFQVVRGNLNRLPVKLSRVRSPRRYSGDTTEEDFHRLLDANPDDHHTRLVFADWLQERGDPRAEGYRALGTLRKQPFPDRNLGTHAWTVDNNDNPAGTINGNASNETYPIGSRHGLPRDWMTALAPPFTGYWEDSDTRREAEDRAATAFSQLPPERRQEIMSGGPEQLSRRRYAAPVRTDFIDALRRARSKQMTALKTAARSVAQRLGFSGASAVAGLHDGPQGATPGLAQSLYGGSPEVVHAAAAWAAIQGGMPGVAVFHARPSGPDRLYQLKFKGSGLALRAKLDRAGIAQRVLVPHATGFDCLIPDPGGQLAQTVSAFAKQNKTPLQVSRGFLKAIGDQDKSAARASFRDTISGAERQQMKRRV